MTAIDPVAILRERLERVEETLEGYASDMRRLERERVALMAAIGALEATAKDRSG